MFCTSPVSNTGAPSHVELPGWTPALRRRVRMSPASGENPSPLAESAVAAPIRWGCFCQDEEWRLVNLCFFLNPPERRAAQ